MVSDAFSHLAFGSLQYEFLFSNDYIGLKSFLSVSGIFRRLQFYKCDRRFFVGNCCCGKLIMIYISFVSQDSLLVKERFVRDSICFALGCFIHSTGKAFIDDLGPLFAANFISDFIHEIVLL